MRKLGRISSGGGKNKQENLGKATMLYLEKSRLLLSKLLSAKVQFPFNDTIDFARHCTLDYYISLFIKHIDLVDRRILKGETIPHEQKMMSIFEDYTEWIVKGKVRPNVELGKKLSITTDQFDLIVHYQIMNNEQDRDIVVKTAYQLLSKYKSIDSISFDMGHWQKDNKALLELEIPMVLLPKPGKRTAEEKEIENSRQYKHLKNKYSAIESNINELEHRGLARCPCRGYFHFCNYIGMGVCAYNLKKIGKRILGNQVKELSKKQAA
jgi:hypothetical protein